jgi:hypothetical protein
VARNRSNDQLKFAASWLQNFKNRRQFKIINKNLGAERLQYYTVRKICTRSSKGITKGTDCKMRKWMLLSAEDEAFGINSVPGGAFISRIDSTAAKYIGISLENHYKIKKITPNTDKYPSKTPRRS